MSGKLEIYGAKSEKRDQEQEEKQESIERNVWDSLLVQLQKDQLVHNNLILIQGKL